MGTFSQTIEIGPLSGERFEWLQAVVDTGATYTWIPREVLERLSIAPEEQWPFILADGSQRDYPIAWVRIRIDGRSQPSICVFGEPGTQPLLGAFTLEALRLGVDAVNRRLIPTPGLLLGVAKRLEG